MFDIQNVGGGHIEAACSFPYKGYVVSMSSIMMPKDVCILLNGDFVKNRLYSVEEAIKFIDTVTDIKTLVNHLGEVMPSGLRVIDYITHDNPELIVDLKKALDGVS